MARSSVPPTSKRAPTHGPASAAKHVPSAAPGARVADLSAGIHFHIDASQEHVSQDPQTVGRNPRPPTTRKTSDPGTVNPTVGNWYSPNG